MRFSNPFLHLITLLLLIDAHLVYAQNIQPSTPYQRYIILKNDLPITLYPVVQIPEDGNCKPGTTSVRRLIVNSNGIGTGIPAGEAVKVFIPDLCWYNAGRLYLFSTQLTRFETKLKSEERTQADTSPVTTPLCQLMSNGKTTNTGCFTGSAKASYPLDAPAQLVEYTFDALDPVTGQIPIDPNTGKPTPNLGIPMTDIDLSYVDQLYLPVAITLDDQGASNYLGTTMNFATFNNRVSQFIKNSQWSAFAAYTPANWKQNSFNELVSQSYNVPAGYNLFSLVNTQAISTLYQPNPAKPKQCSAWNNCAKLSGNCCPSDSGIFLDCCGVKSYMIDAVSVENQHAKNPTTQQLINRWQAWLKPNDPCSNENIGKITTWPSNSAQFDKRAFCNAFRDTVQYVWDLNDDHLEDCGATIDPNMCIIQRIVGYNSTVLSGKEPESVQAILRSVPYGKKGEALQYHFDKWLLFWAPYNSLFNLDPYTHLIHDDQDGVNAVAYSFSIDDKYGNYREKASGFIVDVGGDSLLLNKQYYDPYEQYFINWAGGWNKATVCGRDVTINKLPGNARIFMWKNGQKTPYCDITLYADDTHFMKFRITETAQSVADSYTGLSGKTIHEINHVDPQYCAQNSSPELKQLCAQTTLSPVLEGELAYVSLSDKDKPTVNLNVPPAPDITPENSKNCAGRTDGNGNPIPCCQQNVDPPQFCPAPYQSACPSCTSGLCECQMNN